MATQSLYRRYRPRRFGELKGQDHVVRALRTAVAEGREGQAYLFSGPRGTGKTTTARILAKVLNCDAPRDGEPCCACESCLAVERGTSYDVHELDAASNNGVDAMRDLIEKASLGTPGRHKVYILDEVHMLSRAAEAALLKTLEEPPPHVVFVLATTDPQKVSETIRSRTQHLRFHLLSADTLADHVRWVADDAGLAVSETAIQQVLRRGGGSARDTLSALELVANSGGDGADVVPLDEFVEAMIGRDAGRALTMIADAIGRGRDPRTLTEELVAHLRDGFLALMAPELVQLPTAAVETLSVQARRLGAAGLVRGIEQLGAALLEMRHAPDPRVLLDVAVVKLTADDVAPDLTDVAARLQRLEQAVAAAATGAPPRAASSPSDVATAPSATAEGRAQLGARARRAADRRAAATATSPPGEPGADLSTAASSRAVVSDPPTAEPTAAESGMSSGVAEAVTRDVWEQTVRPGLRGMARAVYAPAEFVRVDDGTLVLALPNEVHRGKCRQHRDAVESALAALAGRPMSIELEVGGAAPDDGGDRARPSAESRPTDRRSAGGSAAGGDRPRAPQGTADAAGADDDIDDTDDIDPDELVDAPPESVKTPIDRLAEAFPGSELVEERD